MNLFTYLVQQSHHKQPVTFFSAKREVPVLLNLLGNVVTRSQNVQYLDVSTVSVDQIHAQLQMSFLGASMALWLTHCNALDATSFKVLIKELQSYSGPNTVFCFISESKRIKDTVSLPEIIDVKSFQQLWQVIYPDKKMNKPFVNLFFSKRKNIPVDQACLLMHYAVVLGRHAQQFISDWLPEIIEPDYSLFLLSGYLFAKQSKPFFNLWQQVKHTYAEPFWTAFWSDRIFKAFAYKKYMETNRITDARKVGFGLPFSFMNRDYQRVKMEELRELHNALLAVDFRIKNGMLPYFELLFLTFCNNTLK